MNVSNTKSKGPRYLNRQVHSICSYSRFAKHNKTNAKRRINHNSEAKMFSPSPTNILVLMQPFGIALLNGANRRQRFLVHDQSDRKNFCDGFLPPLVHLSTNRAVEEIVVLQHCDSNVEDVNIHSEGLAMLLSWFWSTERPRVAVRCNGTK